MTLPGTSPASRHHDEHGATMLDLESTERSLVETIDRASLEGSGPARVAPRSATSPGRSTVLPRIEVRPDGVPELSHSERERYEAQKVLGEGGMGTVLLARDHDIDRVVAVKQIRREVAGPTGIARFAEEVRIIGRLEHPNIVPIHDVGVDASGNYFFVMKYVEGETLEAIIEKLARGDEDAHRKYGFEARARIMMGLLRALSYAHDRGVVHRDIKPANIMVGRYGEVVLMDWGIAKTVDRPEIVDTSAPTMLASEPRGPISQRRLLETGTAQIVGTPAYMSPEQVRGARDLDARSDLYSVAVVFHELLALRHYLSDAKTLGELIHAVQFRDRPPPWLSHYSHARFAPTPAEYIHFTSRGLAKDPKERWSSAAEMIDELERVLDGRMRVQCPITLTKRVTRETGRFVDRHPWAATAAFGTLIISAVSALVVGAMAVLH